MVKEHENFNYVTTFNSTECIAGYTTSLPTLLNRILFFTAPVDLKTERPNRDTPQSSHVTTTSRLQEITLHKNTSSTENTLLKQVTT